MSGWLASKLRAAEDLLSKIDQSAAQSLKKDARPDSEKRSSSTAQTSDTSSKREPYKATAIPLSPEKFAMPSSSITSAKYQKVKSTARTSQVESSAKNDDWTEILSKRDMSHDSRAFSGPSHVQPSKPSNIAKIVKATTASQRTVVGSSLLSADDALTAARTFRTESQRARKVLEAKETRLKSSPSFLSQKFVKRDAADANLRVDSSEEAISKPNPVQQPADPGKEAAVQLAAMDVTDAPSSAPAMLNPEEADCSEPPMDTSSTAADISATDASEGGDADKVMDEIAQELNLSSEEPSGEFTKADSSDPAESVEVLEAASEKEGTVDSHEGVSEKLLAPSENLLDAYLEEMLLKTSDKISNETEIATEEPAETQALESSSQMVPSKSKALIFGLVGGQDETDSSDSDSSSSDSDSDDSESMEKEASRKAVEALERARVMAASLAKEQASLDAARKVLNERRALTEALESEREAAATVWKAARQEIETLASSLHAELAVRLQQLHASKADYGEELRLSQTLEAELEVENAVVARQLAAAQRDLEDAGSRLLSLRVECEALDVSMAAAERRITAMSNEMKWPIGSERDDLRGEEGDELTCQLEDVNEMITERKSRVAQLEEELQLIRANERVPSVMEIELDHRLKQLIDHLIQRQAQVENIATEKSTVAFRLEAAMNALREEKGGERKRRDDKYDSEGYSSFVEEDLEVGLSRAYALNRIRKQTVQETDFGYGGKVNEFLSQLVDVAWGLDTLVIGGASYIRTNSVVRRAVWMYVLLLHCWVAFVWFMHYGGPPLVESSGISTG